MLSSDIIANAQPLSDPIAQLGGALIEMFDAERAGDFTIATGVSAWAGVKGAITLTQGTAGAQPVRSTTSFGGGAGVTFDGSDDFLTVNLAGQLPANAAHGEIYALVSMDNLLAAAAQSLIAYGSTSAAASRVLLRPGSASTNRARISTGTAGSANTVTGQFDFSGRCVLYGIISPTVTWGGLNSISLFGSVEVVPATTATRLRFGANAAGTAAQFFGGKIAAVLFTNQLAPNLRGSLLAYLFRRRRI